MKIFLPSLFKTRVVTLIIAFFLLCFFVGFLKNCFADTYRIIGRGPLSAQFTQDIPSSTIWAQKANSISESNLQIEYLTNWSGTQHWTPGINYIVYVCNDTTSTIKTKGFSAVYGTLDYRDYLMFLPELSGTETYEQICQVDPCESQKNQLITSCGGDNDVDWSTWNDSTCTGYCKISRNANLGSPDLCPIL